MPNYKQKVLFNTHDGAAVMTKTSKLLKVKECQHCTAQALNLLLMTDIITKNSSISGLLRKCKSVVKTLHYKADVFRIMRQLQKLY